MSYPYDQTYLERIQENKDECKAIKQAYYTLLKKHCRDNHCDMIDFGVSELFTILGEAIELESSTVNNLADAYHFLWDVLDNLFGKED